MRELPPTSPLPTLLAPTATILLAGGRGSRLHELTAAESKPAVFFGGRCRIVDFVMANVVRSGLERLLVATQYAPQTLGRHLPQHWGRQFPRGGLALRDGGGRYLGTADALRRNWRRIEAWAAPEVLVLAADHIYEMDYAALIAAHRRSGAPVTVAADVVPRAQARGFGVMQVDAQHRIRGFHEKPADPVAMADRPDCALVSMGIYVFSTDWLRQRLMHDSAAIMDFGLDLIPMAVAMNEAAAWRMPAAASGASYWRDVGTLDALRRAHLDFLTAPPVRLPRPSPVAEWDLGRGSVAMPGARLAGPARLANTILAPDAQVPAGLVTGEDPAEDARWFRRDGETLLVTQAMLERRAALRPRLYPSAGALPRIVA